MFRSPPDSAWLAQYSAQGAIPRLCFLLFDVAPHRQRHAFGFDPATSSTTADEVDQTALRTQHSQNAVAETLANVLLRSTSNFRLFEKILSDFPGVRQAVRGPNGQQSQLEVDRWLDEKRRLLQTKVATRVKNLVMKNNTSVAAGAGGGQHQHQQLPQHTINPPASQQSQGSSSSCAYAPPPLTQLDQQLAYGSAGASTSVASSASIPEQLRLVDTCVDVGEYNAALEILDDCARSFDLGASSSHFRRGAGAVGGFAAGVDVGELPGSTSDTLMQMDHYMSNYGGSGAPPMGAPAAGLQHHSAGGVLGGSSELLQERVATLWLWLGRYVRLVSTLGGNNSHGPLPVLGGASMLALGIGYMRCFRYAEALAQFRTCCAEGNLLRGTAGSESDVASRTDVALYMALCSVITGEALLSADAGAEFRRRFVAKSANNGGSQPLGLDLDELRRHPHLKLSPEEEFFAVHAPAELAWWLQEKERDRTSFLTRLESFLFPLLCRDMHLEPVAEELVRHIQDSLLVAFLHPFSALKFATVQQNFPHLSLARGRRNGGAADSEMETESLGNGKRGSSSPGAVERRGGRTTPAAAKQLGSELALLRHWAAQEEFAPTSHIKMPASSSASSVEEELRGLAEAGICEGAKLDMEQGIFVLHEDPDVVGEASRTTQACALARNVADRTELLLWEVPSFCSDEDMRV